jgi:hypothetical protein
VRVRTNSRGQITSTAFIAATASIESKGAEFEAGYQPMENLRGLPVKLVPTFDLNPALRYEHRSGFFGRAELSSTAAHRSTSAVALFATPSASSICKPVTSAIDSQFGPLPRI